MSYEPEIHDCDDNGKFQRDCRTCRILVLEKRVRKLEELATYMCNTLATGGLRAEADRMRQLAEEWWSEPTQ